MATFSTIPLQKGYNMNPIPSGLTREEEKTSWEFKPAAGVNT
jgi:hypothetical protein